MVSIVDLSGSYTSDALKMGAGGWLVGGNMHGDGTFVVRTDTHGAYLLNRGTSSWTPIVTASSLPSPDSTAASRGGVEEIVSAPSDSNIMYMLFNKKLYKSTNKGTTWTLTAFPAHSTDGAANEGQQRTHNAKIAVDPLNANIVYVGTMNEGLWRSTDGNNFTQVASVPVGLQNYTTTLTSITKANPAVVTYVGADVFTNGQMILITGSDMAEVNGKSFTVAGVNTAANTFQLSGIDSSAYAAAGTKGTINYLAAGTTDNSPGISGICINPASATLSTPTRTAEVMVCSYGNGWYRSTDGGVTFSATTGGPISCCQAAFNSLGVLITTVAWGQQSGGGPLYFPGQQSVLYKCYNGTWSSTASPDGVRQYHSVCWDTTVSTSSITGITKANPAVVTYSGADNFYNGQIIKITGVVGMTQVNGNYYTVAGVNTGANTFQLSGIDSTAYGTYTSGGTISYQDRVVVGQISGATHESVNAGTSWNTAVGSNGFTATDVPWLQATGDTYLSVGTMLFDPLNANRIFCTMGLGVLYQTQSTGWTTAAWVSMSKGIEQLCAVNVIAPKGAYDLMVLNLDRCLFRVGDPDQYPFDHKIQIPGSAINYAGSADYAPEDPNYRCVISENGSFYSTDGGRNWTEWTTYPDWPLYFASTGCRVDTFAGQTDFHVYIENYGFTNSRSKVFVANATTIGGLNINGLWTHVGNGTNAGVGYMIARHSSPAASSVTNGAGASTTAYQTGGTYVGRAVRYQITMLSKTNWLAVGGNTGIWRTLDAGVTWTKCTFPGSPPDDGFATGFMNRRVVAKDTSTSNTAYCYNSDALGGFYKTVDAGVNWTKVGNYNASIVNYHSKMRLMPGTDDLFWCTGEGTTNAAYLSRDGGVNWTAISGTKGIIDFDFGIVAPSKSYPRLYAVGTINNGSDNYGIWYTDDAGVTDTTTWTWNKMATFPANSTDFVGNLGPDPYDADKLYGTFGGSGAWQIYKSATRKKYMTIRTT